jgi:Flp pilus assembly protein TadB
MILTQNFVVDDARVGLVASVGIAITPSVMLWYLERRKIKELIDQTPRFLDRWILNLSVGKAFRSSWENALSSESEQFQSMFRPLFETNANPSRRPHEVLPPLIADEIVRIQDQPHLAVARIDSLRRMLKKSSEFRRKSGQAVSQASIQSLLLLFLHFALITFVVHRHGWREVMDLVIASTILAGAGNLLIYRLARKNKWRI